MKKLALNYILLFTVFFTLVSCASNTYEWVKINPDKIAKARSAQPYSENIKYIDVKVNAKFKAENITYVENSADYFTSQSTSSANPIIVSNTKVLKTNKPVKATSSVKVVSKPITKPIASGIENELQAQFVEDAEAMSKLNSGLIMPKKKRPGIEGKSLFNDVTPVKEVQTTIEKEVAPSNQKVNENLSHDNGLGTLKNQDIELNNKELKNSSLEPLTDNQIKEEGAKRNSYMWIGLVLLIIGLIIGLIFGGLAYFISVVGVVFIVIGYLTKT